MTTASMKNRKQLPVAGIAGTLALLALLAGCSAKSPTNGSAGGSSPSTAPPSAPVAVSKNAAPDPAAVAHEPNLVALSAGAFIVKRPKEWADFESAFNLLDEKPASLWATPRGNTSPQTIVISLPERTVLKTLEFDNSQIDDQFTGCSAKDISVEMSDASDTTGFQNIANVSLKDRAAGQRFPVSAEVPGRWLRLTVKNNHSSDPDNTIELNEFRAYGTQLTHTPPPDVTGTYDVYYTGKLHLKQQGTSITGCYESRQGLVEGGIDGRVFTFTWRDKSGVGEQGPAVMVFTPDGKQMMSLWWEQGLTATYGRLVLGTKISDETGSCPQWAGGVEEQLTKDLDEFGRARVYGINFDTDSDRIKDESKPTLDKIVNLLKAKPAWKITIEGHTDSTSTPEYNQQLSEKRAAAVRNYLQAAGIDPARLKTAGYGSSKPVASNDSELGRAQNRRVELAKQ